MVQVFDGALFHSLAMFCELDFCEKTIRRFALNDTFKVCHLKLRKYESFI